MSTKGEFRQGKGYQAKLGQKGWSSSRENIGLAKDFKNCIKPWTKAQSLISPAILKNPCKRHYRGCVEAGSPLDYYLS